MNKVHYDYSNLMERIKRAYGSFDNFCEAAGLDHVEFFINTCESDLSASEIEKCVKMLDIPRNDIDHYFFTIDESYRNPGRPEKEITKTTTPPECNRYYTIREAVELLGVHRHTLQTKLRKKKLSGKLIGRTWRIYRDELFDNSTHLYYFICNNATYGEKYLTPSQCNRLANESDLPMKEGDIIDLAEKLEAVLYRYDSDQSNPVKIYDPTDPKKYKNINC